MKTCWAWFGKISGWRWTFKEGLKEGWMEYEDESQVLPLNIPSPHAHRWVFLGPQADLEEERIRQKIAERTSEETIRIYSLRLFLNCIVLAVLAACFYAIYRATIFSQEHMKKVSTLWKSVKLLLWLDIRYAKCITRLWPRDHHHFCFIHDKRTEKQR